MRWLFGAGLVLALALVPGCSEEQPPWLGDKLAEPQATSLLGEELYARPDTNGEVAGADAAVAEAPDDVELLLAAARVRWDYEQFRQAIAIYPPTIGASTPTEESDVPRCGSSREPLRTWKEARSCG
jgi:hypothetical protein